MTDDVVVIGGGLSGLAAALELATHGINVRLFEQSPKLGGRCYSYVDEKTGDIVDNGQHILIGAYHHTLQYLERIGTRHQLRAYPPLHLPLHDPIQGFGEFRAGPFFGSISLATGILMFKLLPLDVRWKMLRVGQSLRRWDELEQDRLGTMTIEEWLIALDQSQAAQESFWYPVAISMMNEHPHRASALVFARALRLALLGTRDDMRVLIPIVGQTELYVDSAVRLLRENKAVVTAGCGVEGLEVSDDRVTGVRLSDGTLVNASHVISTIPHFAVKNILPASFLSMKPFHGLDEFRTSPIVSVHLWFDREWMDVDYVGFIGRSVQWVFNRRRLFRDVTRPTSYISAVISGAHEIVEFDREKITVMVLEELREAFPASRKAELVHSVVIKEKRATFSSTVPIESLRPSTVTPIKNFYLAGDWTDTGLPATIEGAVMSGMTAANLVLSR